MADATLVEDLEINDPTKEVVILTASTTNTYTSKKFSTVKGAHLTCNSDPGAAVPYVTISGATVTIVGANMSSETVTLTLYGRK